MQPFPTLPTTPKVRLIVHVYPLGGIDVHYAPEEGPTPMQSAANFGKREALADKLKELGLRDQANMVIFSDAQFDFEFVVDNKSGLLDAFGFLEVGEIAL